MIYPNLGLFAPLSTFSIPGHELKIAKSMHLYLRVSLLRKL